MLKAITTYGLQTVLGIIALVAVWKDWGEYSKRSPKWGKMIRVCVAFFAVLVVFLTFADTHNSRKSSAQEQASLHQQINQMSADAKTANDGFRSSFTGLYDKFSQLQSKVDNEKLLKQNASLYTEIESTKKELLATEAKLSTPKAVLVATFPTEHSNEIPVTELTVSSTDVITFPILIYNASDVTALHGAINVTICNVCTFASEPVGFSRIAGAPNNQRSMDFEQVYARAAMQLLTIQIGRPSGLSPIEVLVRADCTNCPVSAGQSLWIYVQ